MAGKDIRSGRGAYRAGVAVAVVASFLTVWTTIVRDDGNGMGFFMVARRLSSRWSGSPCLRSSKSSHRTRTGPAIQRLPEQAFAVGHGRVRGERPILGA